MLDVGESIRYRGLGAGIVVEHVTRRFQNSERIFAVLSFPHSDLTAQVPVGDPAVAAKIEPLLSKRVIEKLLRELPDRAEVLPRTWDLREEIGVKKIKEGGPEEWVVLLASYAMAEGAGVSVAASDEELVRSAEELLAAELACVTGKEFLWACDKVRDAYDSAAEASRAKRSAEHFEAVEV